jgi:hypothetical protein
MSPLLSQVLQVHRALHTVRVVRRILHATAAALALQLLLRITGWDVGASFAVLPSVALGATVWWLLGNRGHASRPSEPDALARTALWVEEQRVAARTAPDFALTTAVEMLAAGTAVPHALALVAARAMQESPLDAALWRARRAAWQWPVLFGVTCLMLMRVSAADRTQEGAAVATRTVPTGDTARPTATAPLGAWSVRVVPPAYSALPAVTYGDVNNVSALSGSTVVVSGAGPAPHAELTAVNAKRATMVAAREDASRWQFTVLAGSAPQTARVSRGGTTRLLIVEGHADSVPRVSLDAPARDSVFREPRGAVPMLATVQDDIGLTRAHFELIVTSGEGERFTVRTLLLRERSWPGSARIRSTELRGVLDLATLGLQAGDVVHLRAVARDAHPSASREFGSSETRAFRIARPTEYDSVAVEPAPPPEVDKSMLSQRMLLMLTEKLDKAQKRLVRAEVLRESLKLARDQTRLRLAVGDVVFQRLSGESSAEHAHSAGDGHDHGVELQGGKLAMSTSSTTGMLEEGNDSPVVAINQPLLEAYNAMWDAGRALEQGNPHAAIPPMKRALEAIERSRAASRIYLRGKPPQVIVDIGKVRLTGKDTGQVTLRSARAALDARAADRDTRLVRAASQVTTNTMAARDSVALLRVEALGDAPAFAAALSRVLAAMDRGGDATDVFVEARRVLGNVLRTRTTSWSRGVVP